MDDWRPQNEIVEQLGRAPDVVAVPTGYGDRIAGVTRGFAVLRQLGITTSVSPHGRGQPSPSTTDDEILSPQIDVARRSGLYLANSSVAALVGGCSNPPNELFEPSDVVATIGPSTGSSTRAQRRRCFPTSR